MKTPINNNHPLNCCNILFASRKSAPSVVIEVFMHKDFWLAVGVVAVLLFIYMIIEFSGVIRVDFWTGATVLMLLGVSLGIYATGIKTGWYEFSTTWQFGLAAIWVSFLPAVNYRYAKQIAETPWIYGDSPPWFSTRLAQFLVLIGIVGFGYGINRWRDTHGY